MGQTDAAVKEKAKEGLLKTFGKGIIKGLGKGAKASLSAAERYDKIKTKLDAKLQLNSDEQYREHLQQEKNTVKALERSLQDAKNENAKLEMDKTTLMARAGTPQWTADKEKYKAAVAKKDLLVRKMKDRRAAMIEYITGLEPKWDLMTQTVCGRQFILLGKKMADDKTVQPRVAFLDEALKRLDLSAGSNDFGKRLEGVDGALADITNAEQMLINGFETGTNGKIDGQAFKAFYNDPANQDEQAQFESHLVRAEHKLAGIFIKGAGTAGAAMAGEGAPLVNVGKNVAEVGNEVVQDHRNNKIRAEAQKRQDMSEVWAYLNEHPEAMARKIADGQIKAIQTMVKLTVGSVASLIPLPFIPTILTEVCNELPAALINQKVKNLEKNLQTAATQGPADATPQDAANMLNSRVPLKKDEIKPPLVDRLKAGLNTKAKELRAGVNEWVTGKQKEIEALQGKGGKGAQKAEIAKLLADGVELVDKGVDLAELFTGGGGDIVNTVVEKIMTTVIDILCSLFAKCLDDSPLESAQAVTGDDLLEIKDQVSKLAHTGVQSGTQKLS